MIPPEYERWLSAKDKYGNTIVGQLSNINRWLGTGYKGKPWGAINRYLPDGITELSEYKEYTVVSKYNGIKGKEGIEVEFGGDFLGFLKGLSKQVVFKEKYDNVLVAELIDGNDEYEIRELPDNYKLESWTMTRIISQYGDKNYESALVTMKWAWTGEINEGDGIERHESELQWTWHPYEPE